MPTVARIPFRSRCVASALRLARVKRYRDDKRAADADNMDSVRKIFAAQSGTT